jgi:hypothetical protein
MQVKGAPANDLQDLGHRCLSLLGLLQRSVGVSHSRLLFG